MSIMNQISKAVGTGEPWKPQQPEIPTQLDLLQVDLELLYKRINELEEKLKPVLSAKREVEVVSTPDVVIVPLAATVREKAAGIKRARVDIEALIKRIEM